MSRSTSPRAAKWILPAMVASTVALAWAAMFVGSAELSPGAVLLAIGRALCGEASDTAARIVLDIRLPRVLLAMAVGAGMGVAGTAAQNLFRNPLASPYVLGVSNGAAVGAVAAMLLAGRVLGYAAVVPMSLLGGMGVSALVYAMAARSNEFGHSLLLAGIATSAFCSALTAGALYLAGERLQTLVFWLMGGLWQATWNDVLLMLPVTLAALAVLTWLATAMNVALVGERSAADLGVHVERLHFALLVVVAVTTSTAVAVSGVIGFVGLIVPHFMRLVSGSDHRRLVPLAALGGAILLLAADTLARTVAAPAEVPVGIVTALVGAPTFLWLLRRRQRQGRRL